MDLFSYPEVVHLVFLHETTGDNDCLLCISRIRISADLFPEVRNDPERVSADDYFYFPRSPGPHAGSG